MRLHLLTPQLAVGCWSLLFALASAPALAQEGEPEQAGRALREAATLRDAGDVEGARERLDEARARWPADARVSFALGTLRVSQGELAQGWALLREASHGSDPLVREAAAEQLALLSPSVAVVTIQVQAAPRGARLVAGSETLPLGPDGEVELVLPPGEHEVVVRDASGIALARGRVRAARGSVEGTTLQAAPLERVAEAQAAPAPSPAPSPSPSEVAGVRVSDDDVWIAVGVASASVALTAIVTTVVAVVVGGGQQGEPMGTVPGIVLRGRM